MSMKFLFKKKNYLKKMGYKYVLSWLTISIVFILVISRQSTVTLFSTSVVFGIFLCFTILLLLNRMRRWKNTQIVLHDNWIQYKFIDILGFEANTELGSIKKRRVYNIYNIKKIEISKSGVVIYGEVLCEEHGYINETASNIHKTLTKVKIVPYFEEWNVFLSYLKKINGVNIYEK